MRGVSYSPGAGSTGGSISGAAVAAALSGAVIPNHRSTEQAAKTGNYTLAATDSGTSIPVTSAATITVPTYAAGFAGFGCRITAHAAVTVDGPGSTNLTLASGDHADVWTANGAWYGTKYTPTAL